MADLAEFAKSLETNAVQALKLMQNITGVSNSVTGLMDKIQNINQQLYGLSVANTAVGKSFEQIKSETAGIMRQFNFTADSVISMQKTLMTGFREPVADIESFQNILNRSRQVFGNNEAAARSFIEQLAHLDKTSIGLRDNFLELVKVLGKTDGLKTGTQAEIERGNALKDLTRSQIEMKYRINEIDRDQYLSYMKIINGKTAEEEKLLKMTEKVQQSRQATSAIEAVMVKKGDSEALAELIGFVNNLGSAVAASGIDVLTEQLEAYAKARKDIGATQIGKDEKAIIDSIIAQATSEKEAIKALEGALGKEEATKIADQNKSVIAENLAKHRMQEAKAAETYKQITEGTLPLETQREFLLTKISERNKTLNQNYMQMRDTLQSSVQALKTMSELTAYAGVNAQFSGTGFSTEEISKQREQMAQVAAEREKSLKVGISEMEEFGKKFNSLNKDQIEKEAIKAIEARKYEAMLAAQANAHDAANEILADNVEREKQLQKFRETGNADDLKFLTSETERINGINKMEAEVSKLRVERTNNEREARKADFESRIRQEQITIEKLQSQNDVLQSQISLMDSLAVGIGANAQIREQAARNLIEQAKQEEFMIKDIKQARMEALKYAQDMTKDETSRLVAAEQATKLEIELGKHIANRNNLNKQALDQLQKLREGYLDAINSMESGAGMFTEIVVDQNKNLGALIRTTEEVPRVLRTGAGSGGITQASQFGPGGLVGGFGPKSEEYSKHVITSMDDIQKLVQDLPKQIGENIALAAGARPEYTGQIVGAATPGKAGTIVAPAGSPAVPGVDVEGPPSPVAPSAGNQGSAADFAAALEKHARTAIDLQEVAAQRAASNIDMSNMVKEISTTIQRGVVDAVKKGMSAAVSELAKQVAPE